MSVVLEQTKQGDFSSTVRLRDDGEIERETTQPHLIHPKMTCAMSINGESFGECEIRLFQVSREVLK